MEFKHFLIHELAEGVYAAVHKEGGAAYSNAGIIDLGDSTLVFDTFDMTTAGKELRDASQNLTGRPPSWVVISHKHGDHWGGTQVFAGMAVIIATHMTRAGMLEWGEELTRLAANPGEIVRRIGQLKEKIIAEEDKLQRAALEKNLIRNEYLLTDLPDFQFTPPSLTFSGIMSLRGSERSVVLTTVEKVHTPQECYLTIPGTKIMFTGDLAFFACPPFIASDSYLDGWLGILDKFGATDIDCFIPGHGPLGSHQDLVEQKDYLVFMRDLVTGAVTRSHSLEKILKIPEPAQFSKWGAFPQRHENNLRSIYTQVIKEKTGGL